MCANPAVKAWNMHCCLQCGWNVQHARKTVQKLKFVPYAWVGFACFVFLGLWFEPGANSRLAIILFCGAMAAVGFLPLIRLRRAKAILANHDGGVITTAVEAAISRIQSEWEWLMKTLPPREFRLTRKGRRNLIRSILSFLCVEVMLSLCVAGNYWLFHRQYGHRAGRLMLPLIVWGVVVLVFYTVFFWGFLIIYHRKARRLLAEGQAIVGRLASFKRAGSGCILNIEFPHPLGDLAKARGAGPSEAYFEGMTLPVFCNPFKLKDSFVLLKDGDYEIARPGLSDAPVEFP